MRYRRSGCVGGSMTGFSGGRGGWGWVTRVVEGGPAVVVGGVDVHAPACTREPESRRRKNKVGDVGTCHCVHERPSHWLTRTEHFYNFSSSVISNTHCVHERPRLTSTSTPLSLSSGVANPRRRHHAHTHAAGGMNRPPLRPCPHTHAGPRAPTPKPPTPQANQSATPPPLHTHKEPTPQAPACCAGGCRTASTRPARTPTPSHRLP